MSLSGFLKKIYKLIVPSYRYRSKYPHARVLVSYLTEPFFRKHNVSYLNGHQNRRETLIIAEVLKKLYCSFKFVRLDKTYPFLKGYSIIFGVEPNFLKACKKNPKAIKIYYATGAYCYYQDKMVVERTNSFNEKHGMHIKYYRRPIIHNACEIADVIFQIGTENTLITYPPEIRNKIILIRQTCHTFRFDNFIERKIQSFNKNEYVWMGTGGSILKGLDVVLDYFLLHPELKLNVIGPVDKEVLDYYRPLLKENIILHGYLDLDSSELEGIALRSVGVIMLSASEGCPGAVVNMAKLGCIPIVSPICAIEGAEQYGFITRDISIDALDDSLSLLTTLTNEEIIERILLSSKMAVDTYNKKSFFDDLSNAFMKILN